MGFLLSLVPTAWLEVAKKLPWRLIGYAVAAIVVVWLVLLVNSWRVDSNRLEATENALARRTEKLGQCTADAQARQDAFTAAALRAKSIEAEDRKAAEEVKRELKAKLAAADAGSRDLGRRLRDYEKRRCGGTVSLAATAVGGTESTGGEPGGTSEVDRRTDEYHAACDRDAARLDSLNELMDRAEENR